MNKHMATVSSIFRFIQKSLILLLLCSVCWACTTTRPPIRTDEIPQGKPLTPEDLEFARDMLTKVAQEHPVDFEDPRRDELQTIMNKLVEAAKSDQYPWQLYLLRAPDMVKVRAVHGYHLFVWSGFLDAIKSEEERAAVLAEALAHVLARHTDPVIFEAWSEVLFATMSIATEIALQDASRGSVQIKMPPAAWKDAYIRLFGLDPLNRDYSNSIEIEALRISVLMLKLTDYSPESALALWKRAESDRSFADRIRPLYDDLSPAERVKLLDNILQKLSDWKIDPLSSQSNGKRP